MGVWSKASRDQFGGGRNRADSGGMKVIGDVVGYVGRLLRQPKGELSRAQRTVRFWLDLSRHCGRELQRNQATHMAAALTYRTIFSLVPIAVLMLLVFRAFGGFEQVSTDLQGHVYEYLGLTSITLATQESVDQSTATEGVAVVGAQVKDESQRELRASIDKVITDLTQKASEVNVGSVGVVGLVVLIWGAIGLLVTVEGCFNQIYNSASGRSWHLRVPIYWSVITLGPVLLWVSLYVAGQSVGQVERLVQAGGLGWVLSGVLGLLGRSAALAASWLLLFLLYVLMPTPRVRLRPALAGALVAAVLWEAGKVGFKLYVSRAVSYSVLYGTLGLVPLFLLWLYVTWWVVLFGLEITYTLQAMRGRVFEKQAARINQQAVYDGRWLLPMMTQIGRVFVEGKTIREDQLSQELGLPERAVVELGERLYKAGLVHRVAESGDDQGAYTLAKRPEDIPVKQLLELGQSLGDAGVAGSDQPGWAYLQELGKAQRDAAGDTTVAGLIKK